MASISQRKRNQVREDAQAKQQLLDADLEQNPVTLGNIDWGSINAGRGNSAGMSTASDLEADLRSLSPLELSLKYGREQADQMIAGRNEARGTSLYYQTQTPSLGSKAVDLSTGLVSGALSGIADVGGMLASAPRLVGSDLGQGVSSAFFDGSRAIRDGLSTLQSDSLNFKRDHAGRKSALQDRDTQALYDARIAAGDSALAAGGEQFWQDFKDGAGNFFDDGETALQSVVEGSGSFISGGLITKGIKAVGSQVLKAAGKQALKKAAAKSGAKAMSRAAAIEAADRGVYTAGTGGAGFLADLAGVSESALQRRVAAHMGTKSGKELLAQYPRALGETITHLAEGVAWPVSTGLLEGSSAMADTIEKVMNLDYDTLEQNSEYYRSLLPSMTPEEARRKTAFQAGGVAGVWQGAVGFGTGFLTKWAEHPFNVRKLTSAAMNVGVFEPTEEFLQSASGELIKNIQVKRFADETQGYTEGVGKAGAEGMFTGMGMAGMTQAPGMALRLPVAAGRKLVGAGKAAGEAAVRKLEDIGKKAGADADAAASSTPNSPAKPNTVTLSNAAAASQAQGEAVQAVSDSLGEVIQKAAPQAAVPSAAAEGTASPEGTEEAGAEAAQPVIGKLTLAESQELAQAHSDLTDGVAEAYEAISPELAQKLSPEHASQLEGKLPSQALTELATGLLQATKEGRLEDADNFIDGILAVSNHLEALSQKVESALSATEDLMNKAFDEGSPEAAKFRQSMADLREGADAFLDMDAMRQDLAKYAALQRATRKSNRAAEAQQQNTSPTSARETGNAPVLSQTEANRVIRDAQLDPMSVDPDELANLKALHRQGSIELNPDQLRVLEGVTIALDALNYFEHEVKARKLTESEEVRKDISDRVRARADGKDSVAVHIQGILDAVRRGAHEEVKTRMENFRRFAESRTIKVNTLNRHFRKGSPKGRYGYKMLAPESNPKKLRVWVPSLTRGFSLFINPKSEKSLNLAQMIELESETVVDSYNKVEQLLPQYFTKSVEHAKLDPKVRALIEGGGMARGEGANGRTQAEVDALSEEDPYFAGKGEVSDSDSDSDSDVEDSSTSGSESSGSQNQGSEAQTEEARRKAIEEQVRRDLEQKFRQEAEEKAKKEAEERAKKEAEAKARKEAEDRIRQEAEEKARKAIEQAQKEAEEAKRKAEEEIKKAQQEAEQARREAEEARKKAEAEAETEAQKKKAQAEAEAQAKAKAEEEARAKAEAEAAAKAKTEAEAAATPTATPTPTPTPESTPTSETSFEADPNTEEEGQSQEQEQGEEEDEKDPEKDKAIKLYFDRVYDTLTKGARKMFSHAFEARKRDRSNFANAVSPMDYVMDALDSDIADTKNPERLRNLRNLKAFLDGKFMAIARKMDSELNRVIGKNSAKVWIDGKEGTLPISEAIERDDVVYVYEGLRTLALVSKNAQGKYEYNNELLQRGILAGLLWFTQQGPRTGKVTREQAAKILQIKEAEVTPAMMQALRTHDGYERVLTGLTEAIMRAWDLSPRADAKIDIVQGIARGFASELLEAMADESKVKLLEKKNLPWGGEGESAFKKLVLFRRVPKLTNNDTSAIAYSGLLESIMMSEAQGVIVTDPTELKAPRKQQHKNINNTREQREIIEQHHRVPMVIDESASKVPQLLGAEGLIELLSEPTDGARNKEGEAPLWNHAHLTSVEGKNLQIRQSLASLETYVNETSLLAEEAGVELGDFPTYMQANVTATGRVMYSPGFNPQSNKIWRGVLGPTRRTVDLSKKGTPEYEDYHTALAQAFGVKIDRNSPKNNVKELAAILARPEFKKVVQSIQGQFKDHPLFTGEETADGKSPPKASKELLEEISAALGGKASELGIYALFDYARFSAASKAEKAAYTTNLYIEQDGIANGPSNAIMLLGLGAFTEGWFDSAELAGLGFGNEAVSYWEIHKKRQKDLYIKGTEGTLKALDGSIKRFQAMAKSPNKNIAETGRTILKMHHDLFTLMSMIMPDVKFSGTIDENGNGVVELARNLMKDPLMQTVYGLQANSMRKGFVDALEETLQERMSAALKLHAKTDPKAPVGNFMFPDHANPEQAWNEFVRLYQNLTDFKIDLNRKTGVWSVKQRSSPDTTFSQTTPKTFQEYSINSLSAEGLGDNLGHILTNHISVGVRHAITPEVQRGMEHLWGAANFQSVWYAEIFQQAVYDLIAEKQANPKDDFDRVGTLSEADVKELGERFFKLAPNFMTKHQAFELAGSVRAKLSGKNTMASATLTGALKSHTDLRVPEASGVAAAPYLIQGMGDARATMEVLKEHLVLQIYDGIHAAVGESTKIGLASNKGVAESWKDNPFQHLDRMLGKLSDNLTDEQMASLSYEGIAAVLKAAPALGRIPESGIAVWAALDMLKGAPATAEGATKIANVDREIRKMLDSPDVKQFLPRSSPLAKYSPSRVTNVAAALAERKAYLTELAGLFGRELIISTRETTKAYAQEGEARRRTMKQFGFSVDQLAGGNAPLHNGVASEIDLAKLSNKKRAEVMNAVYYEELRKIREQDALEEEFKWQTQEQERQAQELARTKGSKPGVDTSSPKTFAELAEKHGTKDPSGAVVLEGTAAVDGLLRLYDPKDGQRVILHHLRAAKALEGARVVVGSLKMLREMLKETPEVFPENLRTSDGDGTNGWYDLATDTTYLMLPSAETVVHELTHATTLRTLREHYEGTSRLGKEDKAAVAQAVTDLEALLELYVRLDTSEWPAEARARHSEVMSLYAASSEKGSAARVMAVSEMQADLAANNAIIALLNKPVADLKVRLGKRVNQYLSKIFFGNKKITESGRTFFEQVFQASKVIIESQARNRNPNGPDGPDGPKGPGKNSGKLDNLQPLHRVSSKTDQERLSGLRGALDQLVRRYVQQGRTAAEKVVRQEHYSQSFLRMAQAFTNLDPSVFAMTVEESTLFRHIGAVLTTELSLDSGAVIQAQKLFTHVLNQLAPENLDKLEKVGKITAAEKLQMGQHYDALFAAEGAGLNQEGQSQIFGTFLGLAAVSTSFRDTLSKLALPESFEQSLGKSSFDRALGNLGQRLQRQLQERLANQKNAANVNEAIDNLMEQIQIYAESEADLLDHLSSPLGEVLDAGNAAVINVMERIGDAAWDFSEKAVKTPGMGSLALAAQVMAGVLHEKHTEKLRTIIQHGLDTMRFWEPLRDFLKDVLGPANSALDLAQHLKRVKALSQKFRKQIREEVPKLLLKKFKTNPNEAERSLMHRVLGRTDFTSLLGSMKLPEALDMLGSAQARKQAIKALEAELRDFTVEDEWAYRSGKKKHTREESNILGRKRWSLRKAKAKQLAKYMMTGVPGDALQRNADAIWALTAIGGVEYAGDERVKALDRLVTLYALEEVSEKELQHIRKMFETEREGMEYLTSVLQTAALRENKYARETSARFNSLKGYVPVLNEPGHSIRIAQDGKEGDKLRSLGFVRIGDYKGSSRSPVSGHGYYLATHPVRTAFHQGALQTIQETSGGVSLSHGIMTSGSGGVILDPKEVRKIREDLKSGGREANLDEALIPIYTSTGYLVGFERPLAPEMARKIPQSTDLLDVMGVWMGRQLEELSSTHSNEVAVELLYKEYKEAKEENEADGFVNLYELAKIDPVVKDAVKRLTPAVKGLVADKFGKDRFMVRRSQVNEAIGYRMPSIGDLWTGNTRWSKDVQLGAQVVLTKLLGPDAFVRLTKLERQLQGLVYSAKNFIIVRSVVVPIINSTMNVAQLMSRGVPLRAIIKGTPRILNEVETFQKNTQRLVAIDLELSAAPSQAAARRLEAERQSIKDANRNMRIWPLLKKGELSTIANQENLDPNAELKAGEFSQWIDNQVAKLPEGVRSVGGQLIMSRDTTLYKGMEKLVLYGDFVAKALYYEDLIHRQKLSEKEAYDKTSIEFIDYDRLPGRGRHALESLGMLWFWNYKLRSIRIALNTFQKNPLTMMLHAAVPMPGGLDRFVLPQFDNLIGQFVEGTLGYSVGPGMGFRSVGMLPIGHIFR